MIEGSVDFLSSSSHRMFPEVTSSSLIAGDKPLPVILTNRQCYICSAMLCYAIPSPTYLCSASHTRTLHLLCATTNRPTTRRCNASRSLLIAMKKLHRQYLWAALKCGLKCTSRSSLSFVCSIIYRWQNVISWSILQILDFTAIKAYRWRSALVVVLRRHSFGGVVVWG